MQTAVLVFTCIVGGMAAFSTCYILFYAIAGRLLKSKPVATASKFSRFAILIPGYKEDAVIQETVAAALKHNYPKGHFDVYVLADHFEARTVAALRDLGATVFEFNLVKSTKAASINMALQRISSKYENVLILDADNIMAHNALHIFNNYLTQGYKAVQGQRIAKNKNTAFALLDAANESINNHIFRKGHTAAGLPCALIGSGMAFDFQLYKQLMLGLDHVTGEDKELEMRLLKQKIDIAYASQAIIYDEKVQQSAVFAKQRQRWLATQLHQAQHHAHEIFGALATFNIGLMNKIAQAFVLPRTLLLGIQLLLLMLNLLWGNTTSIYFAFASLVATSGALLLALPQSYYTSSTLHALLHLPLSMYFMLKGLFGMKAGKKEFIHTPHGIN